MKIFCKFPTMIISKLNFCLVICMAKNFIWTTFFFALSDFRFSNGCILAKYWSMYKTLFKKKLTLMTGFVVQGHILCGEHFQNLKNIFFTIKNLCNAKVPWTLKVLHGTTDPNEELLFLRVYSTFKRFYNLRTTGQYVSIQKILYCICFT